VSTAIRSVLLATLLAVVGGIVALPFIDHLTPFDLARPPNLLTRLHLQLLERDPERCYAALDRAKISYRRAAPLRSENGCGHDDAVWLERSEIEYGSRVLLRCPAMLGLLMWERHVLAPAAEQHFQRKLAALRHLGTYSCRGIRESGRGSLSQHAYANAIDVAGFTVTGGPSMTLRRDWKDDGASGAFLRDVRDGACRIFGVVLSPDHDRNHANHFHLDMSWLRACR
jgi:hypothetical protein